MCYRNTINNFFRIIIIAAYVYFANQLIYIFQGKNNTWQNNIFWLLKSFSPSNKVLIAAQGEGPSLWFGSRHPRGLTRFGRWYIKPPIDPCLDKIRALRPRRGDSIATSRYTHSCSQRVIVTYWSGKSMFDYLTTYQVTLQHLPTLTFRAKCFRIVWKYGIG